MRFRCLESKKISSIVWILSNSLSVRQMYEDKSLVLRARDLIFFTIDLETVHYYSLIHR